VNIAARLCGIAKRGQTLVCDCTFGRMSDSDMGVLKPTPQAGSDQTGGEGRADGESNIPSGLPLSGKFTFIGPYKARLKGKLEAQRVYLLVGIPATMMEVVDGET
jgi:hypothetical protein